MSGERTPGSRLSEDLYRLYLAGLGWLIFPVYADQVSVVLPSRPSTAETTTSLVIVACSLLATWSGVRGGPMMISRAAVVHELGSAASPGSVLFPILFRQAITAGATAAVASSTLVAFTGAFGFGRSMAVSAALSLAASAAVLWALVWMTAVRSSGSARGWLLTAAGCGVGIPVVLVGIGLTPTGRTALLMLAINLVAGLVISRLAVGNVSVEHFWGRAAASESLRSAVQGADFHRMLVDLRRVGEQRATSARALAQPWMPNPLWRFVSATQHQLGWSLLRLGAGLLVVVALMVDAAFDDGVVLLAFGAAWLAIGFELARSLAATADQSLFLLHYRRGSFPVLVGQLVVMALFAGVCMAVSLAWRFQTKPELVSLTLVLAASGVVGGAMQARLGSPDVAYWTAKFGFGPSAWLLWVRALAAPLLVVGVAVILFHSVVEPIWVVAEVASSPVAEIAADALFPASLVLLACGLVISVWPLEASIR